MEQPVIVILGASGGIGSQISQQLARSGVKVICAGRSLEKLTPLAEAIDGEAVQCDGTSSAEVDALFQGVFERYGRVDGAANLIGSIVLKPVHLTSDEEWTRTISINLNSAFYLLRSAVKVMKNGGSVLLCSTAAARIGLPNHEAIAAAKGGVSALALSAAATYAPQGIRVNVLAPGLVQTPLSERITSNEASRKASLGMHPLGRLGEAEEVARVGTFLLSPENSWITGQIFGIDGGLGTVRTR